MQCVCKHCGETFTAWASDKRTYCSRNCFAQSGSNASRRHSESRTRLHGIWCHMKTRCTCPTSKAFEYYGGRGISVCAAWMESYEAFRDWALANGYSDNLTLDRFPDANGNYEPSNCRWATKPQQSFNTRKRRDGITSPFKGVSWCANVKKWRAQLSRSGRNTHVALRITAVEAAIAYDDAAFEARGNDARFNFPERIRSRQRKEVSHFNS